METNCDDNQERLKDSSVIICHGVGHMRKFPTRKLVEKLYGNRYWGDSSKILAY